MVRSSIAVHDLRRSLFKPIVCWAGHIPLLVAAVKSGNEGHDENKRDAFNCWIRISKWNSEQKNGEEKMDAINSRGSLNI